MVSIKGGVGQHSCQSPANPLVTPDTTGYYYVKGTAANACFALDSVLIRTKLPAMFSISPKQSAICAGDSLKIILQETNGAAGDGWLWISDIGSQDPSEGGIVVSPSSAAVYQVVTFDRTCRKQDTLTASVAVNQSPKLTVAKSNDIDCIYGQATLTATGGVAYSWSPAGTLTDPESASPVASTDTTTLYYVKVTGENGCAAVDSIRLNVSKSPGGTRFPVANAFTPNGDGVNDCFGVKYWGYTSNFEISVFNRWGVRVFYSRNPGDCWDGTFGGKPQPAGTYVYMIKAFALCGEAFRRGTVELIR
jgi:gliding motility-associated-like protein